MKLNLKLPILLCAFVGILTACETLPPPKPVERPAQLLTLDEVSQALTARQESIHNVKSRVKTRITNKEGNHNLKQVLIINGETLLRLDTLSLFGQPVGVLIFNPEQVLLYDTDSNKLYRDAEVWDIMVRMFGAALDFREYISVFSGKIPRLASLTLQGLRWSPETGNYHISATDPERHEQLEIEVDPEFLLPRRLVKRKNGKAVYVALWEDYQEIEGFRFPKVIKVRRPLQKDEVSMQFNNPLINRGVTEETFQLNVQASN